MVRFAVVGPIVAALAVAGAALPCRGQTQATTAPAPTPPEVRLVARLPEAPFCAGRPAALTLSVAWEGSWDDWRVLSVEGPPLRGFREVWNRVRASVASEAGRATCGEERELGLLAPLPGEAEIGAVEVRLRARSGEERCLTSAPFRVTVEPAPFGLESLGAREGALAAGGALLVALAWGAARWRTGKRREREEKEAAAVAAAGASTRWHRAVEDLLRAAGAEDAKAFYRSALEAMAGMLGAERADEEALGAAVERAGLSPALAAGLRKVVEEERLVRFAGLQPARDEREGVAARLRELADKVERSQEP